MLHFLYVGKIVQSGPQGLFYQPYLAPGGVRGEMLSTQFESTDARRMFPGWDEPSFRATYALSAVIPAAWKATSNMPIVRDVARGATAPRLFRRRRRKCRRTSSSSPRATSVRSRPRAAARDFGVWAVRGQERDGAYALANAQQILADYDDYFGYTFPLAEARLDRDPRRLPGRDGELGRDHLQRSGAAREPVELDRFATGRVFDSGPRDGAPMERRSRDHGLVGRPLAQ